MNKMVIRASAVLLYARGGELVNAAVTAAENIAPSITEALLGGNDMVYVVYQGKVFSCALIDEYGSYHKKPEHFLGVSEELASALGTDKKAVGEYVYRQVADSHVALGGV